MKVSVSELSKAIDYLKKHNNVSVRIDTINLEVVEITGSDTDGDIVTIKIYDNENNNSFAKITETRRL